MASGLLSGRFSTERAAALPEDDWRKHHPDFSGERLARNLDLVERLGPVAKGLGCRRPAPHPDDLSASSGSRLRTREPRRPPRRMTAVRARAPGRVNLIGDHTDYTGGLVLPMAIDLETAVSGDRVGDVVSLASGDQSRRAEVPLVVKDPAAVEPRWARYVAGVVAEMRPPAGFRGEITTTLPVGAGLSSSAALEVAVALALGFAGTTLDLALLCQAAEQVASGVPCGIMDQLASAAGVEGHALLIDCTTMEVDAVPLPEGVDVVVVHSGLPRNLGGTAYAERRQECSAAEERIGPLREATLADVSSLDDPVLRRRARHVVGENERVRRFADALAGGRLGELGPLMAASHASLRDDFEVSTLVLDDLVARLQATPGVLGARLTGAGFGGCAVAIARSGTELPGWRVRAAAGASVT